MQIDSYVSERRRNRKKRQGYFWGIVIFLVVYFICLGAFLFFVRLPAFQAEKITVTGNSTVPTADIMNLLHAVMLRKGAALNEPNDGWNALLGFKNMLIWPAALPTSTLTVIPQLAGVTIKKDYFLHTITVTVTERHAFGVWCIVPAADSQAEEQCFWFDGQGTAFQKTIDTQGNAIFVIHDYAPGTVSLGEKVLPDEFMPNLISILNALTQSGLNIQAIALDDLSLEQLDVTTVNGPVIYFSLRFPASEDLGELKNIIAKPGFNKLQYIDFTVENRAYYK
jgi:hypothetical protein